MQYCLLDIKPENSIFVDPEMTDQTSSKLLSAISGKNLPYYGIGIIPFTHELTGLEGINLSLPTIFFGSCQMAAKIVKDYPDIKPGVFWDSTWWDPREWPKYRTDMLNMSVTELLVKDLRANWTDEPIFVKSIAEKLLTGQVLEADKEDHDRWLIDNSHLDGDDLLISSPVEELEAEWRFFIIDGRIVTGSMYRHYGVKRRNLPIPEEVWEIARNKLKKDLLPSPEIVMDLALTKSGEYKIVEFNCINCSGVYNSDVNKLITAIENYDRNYYC